MIKIVKFLAEKIVIIEVMLMILYLAGNYFSVTIPYITDFISMALTYLTPISIVALVIYIIFSLLDHEFIKILLAAFLIFLAYLYFTNKL
jgi:hypothetical protein